METGKLSMQLIAERISKVKPSPTLALSNKANELKKSGIDVLNLTVGEPDFDTPANIVKAANEAMCNGKTKYTSVDGIAELKEAIRKKFKQGNNLEYAINQITVGSGGKQVIFNCFLATLNPGDEVIIPAPFWVSYPDMVALCEGVPVLVKCGAEIGFKLTPELLESAITPKTKWLLINSPSNPTGAAYTREELSDLAAVLRKHKHVHIFSDDIYEHIVYGQDFCTMANVAPDLIDRIFTMNGVSKAYSMTGWRIGYGAGPVEIIKAMAIIQSQSTSNPCSISQYAALEALMGTQDFIKTNCDEFQKKRDIALGMLNQITGISCKPPAGAFYLFPSCSFFVGKKTANDAIIKDDADFCAYLLDEARVAVVPGSSFGLEGFFRVSYATSEKIIVEAMSRIQDACKKLM